VGVKAFPDFGGGSQSTEASRAVVENFQQMFAFGTSRRFAAVQQHVGYRGKRTPT
jgi:hypothetical protein